MNDLMPFFPLLASVLIGNLSFPEAGKAAPDQQAFALSVRAAASPQILVAQVEEKTRIAILDFDYSSLSNPTWFSLFTGGAKGVSDIVINKLVQSGRYSVIERSRLDAVLQEQNLAATGRIDPTTAAQIGRILGVDAVVIGSITQFDLQQRQSGGGLFFGIGASTTDTDAYVKLNIRVVNTTTAEILSVAEGKGNVSQSDSSVRVLGIGGSSSTQNQQKLLTLATEKAVDEVVEILNAEAGKLAASPKALPAVTALVAAVVGNQVVFNKGTGDGYRPGLKLSIERVTQEIKDPATGKVIRRLSQPVGLVEIVEADAQSSVGKVLTGSQFQIGDLAKPTQ